LARLLEIKYIFSDISILLIYDLLIYKKQSDSNADLHQMPSNAIISKISLENNPSVKVKY